MASAVEEQGAATREIARNVQQAAGDTQEVTSNIAGVNQAAGETGTAAAMVLSASGDVARGSSELRESVTSFLARVKAA
jgi:methyl-accepting chemotaxis protein